MTPSRTETHPASGGKTAKVQSAPTGRGGRPGAGRNAIVFTGLLVLLVVSVVGCLAAGRYGVPVETVPQIVLSRVPGLGDLFPQVWTESEARVVLLVRGPRVAEALLIGAGLAVSGAAMQACFRNPLANPQILGVSSGASLGGVLAIAIGVSTVAMVSAAFAGGLLVLLLVWLISRKSGGGTMTVVLTGVILSAFFSALISVVTYMADTPEVLQSIVFWLMGSLASATWSMAAIVMVTTGIGLLVIVPLRWRLNLLTLGDEESQSLGVNTGVLRWTVFVATAVIVGGAVSVSGGIGWVGLVIPHAARLLIGSDHRLLIPASALLGASYLLIIDTLARTMSAGEIPLGALTALVGSPLFFALLNTNKGRLWVE